MAFWEYLWAGSWTTLALRHFNESSGNANDSSGNWYTLTNVWTMPYVAGKFGNWISPAAWKYLKHTTFLDAGVTAWTVSCWIKTTQNVSAGSYGYIIYKTATWNTRPIYMWLNENEKIFVTVSSWTTAWWPNVRTTTSSVNDWVWHNIVAQWSHAWWRASLKVFIDWSLNGSLSTSWWIDWAGIAADNTSDFYFWQDLAWSRAFLWIIDEFIIENRVRTATEIKKQYTMQKWRFGIV